MHEQRAAVGSRARTPETTLEEPVKTSGDSLPMRVDIHFLFGVDYSEIPQVCCET